MSIKSELESLKNEDIYSLLLFALYKCNETNEFSALSELAYLLDETNLLNLCEYFGGMTLTIPTIEDLELMLNGLSMYKSINIDHLTTEEHFTKNACSTKNKDAVKSAYLVISDIMSSYTFGGSDNGR